MQKAKRLTRKDYEVLEAYAVLAQSGAKDPLRQAIIDVYDYEEGSKGLSAKIYNRKRSLTQTKRVAEIFEMAGIDKLKIANKLAELMEAKNPIVFHGEIKKDKDGEPITVPDLRVQLGAIGLVANIAGITQKQRSTDIGKQTNNLFVFVEDSEDARKRIEAIDRESEIIKEGYIVEEPLNAEDGD